MKALKELVTITISLGILILAINQFVGKQSFFSTQNQTTMATKKSDFNLTPEDYTTALQRELTQLQGRLAGELQHKRISRTEANKRYLILEDMLELMKLAREHGIRYQDLKAYLENQEIKPQARQQKLFKRSQHPN